MTFDIKSIDLHIVEDIFCFRSLIGITVQESADKVHGEGSWPTARDVDVARQDFALDDVVVIILNGLFLALSPVAYRYSPFGKAALPIVASVVTG